MMIYGKDRCVVIGCLPGLTTSMPASLAYWGLGVLMGLMSGMSCTFPVTGTGAGRRHFLVSYYFPDACISFNIQLMTIR